jgi:cell wall-associated NlpC family hydrolase
LRTPNLGARAFIIPFALAGAILFSIAPSSPASAATITTEGQQIVQIAKWQIGDPWRYGAVGPYAFDCSGLVRYAYKRAGDYAAIRSGALRSARSMYLWFRSHGKTSRTNPKIGDLVVWGYGSHIGIYIGAGKAISTLTSGVRIHGIYAVRARFTTFIHTGMSTKPVS